jgi:hypothetical protein
LSDFFDCQADIEAGSAAIDPTDDTARSRAAHK